MLRPDGELERPDLMLIMIHHWPSQQRSRRTGGAITISAYVTLIAERLEIPLDADDTCRGPRLLDIDSFHSYKFVQVALGPRGRTYLWRMPDDRTTYPLPFPVSLSVDDRSTWLFTQPPPAAPGHPPSPPTDDVEMPDAHSTPPRVHASTSAVGPSHPADPTTQDLYHLISAMQATQLDILTTQSSIQTALLEQGDSLADIRMEFVSQGSRISAIEDQLRDWRFYEEHGYWPSAPPP